MHGRTYNIVDTVTCMRVRPASRRLVIFNISSFVVDRSARRGGVPGRSLRASMPCALSGPPFLLFHPRTSATPGPPPRLAPLPRFRGDAPLAPPRSPPRGTRLQAIQARCITAAIVAAVFRYRITFFELYDVLRYVEAFVGPSWLAS